MYALYMDELYADYFADNLLHREQHSTGGSG
jgi:hypothetical protein